MSKRLRLSEDSREGAFKDEWQGLPNRGYSFLIENLMSGIPAALNTSSFNANSYDVIVSSAPIDRIMRFKFRKLEYRSLRFNYRRDEGWENDNYGTINLPQHPKYIRKCNFKILHKQASKHTLIQYQESIESDENSVPMYPVNTKKNDKLFDKYLKEICKSKNICPAGRLGLFKYLNMDSAIEAAFDMIHVIEDYLNMSPLERYKRIKGIVASY